MELRIKDVAELLQVSEKTIYRWVKEKAIPVYHINHQYRFDKKEIHDWILANRVKVPGVYAGSGAGTSPAADSPRISYRMRDLLGRGGIFYKIEGADPETCIRNSIAIISLPKDVEKDEVVEKVLDRERLMPTALGRGVAFPHARDPILSRFEDECVSICLLNTPLEYAALDGKQVHSLIFVFAASLRRHLEYMTKLTYFCRDNDFLNLLERSAPRGEILSFVGEKEKQWL